MNAKEAIDALLIIAPVVFPCNLDTKASPDLRLKNLISAIEDLLEARNIPTNTKMHNKSTSPRKCRVCVLS